MAKQKTLPTNRNGTVPVKYDAARDRWVVDYFVNGKRRREFFKTEKEATKAWTDISTLAGRYGLRALNYNEREHAEYEEAKRLCGNADLREIVREWAKMRQSVSITATVSEAIAEFRSQKEGQGRSARHTDTLNYHLAKLEASFDGADMHTITGNAIMRWLASQSVEPRTVRNYHNTLCNFFNWAERRGMVPKAPTASIAESDLPTVPTKGKGVLTIDQTAAMMAWVEVHEPQHAAAYALQAFAGIRAAEVARMDWGWIDVGNQTITLPGWFVNEATGEHVQGTKTADDWVLHDLPDNIWAWLKKYKSEGAVKMRSENDNWRTRKHFKTLPHPIPKWPHNAMRHTFCTMAISLHQSADKVALWSRHTNARQLYKSYVARLVSVADAKRYFAIVPTK